MSAEEAACEAASARPATDAFSGLVSVPNVDDAPAASTMTALDAGWAEEDGPGAEAGAGAGSQSAQTSFWDMVSKQRLRLEVSATLVKHIYVYPIQSRLGDEIRDGINCRSLSRDSAFLQSQPVTAGERDASSKGHTYPNLILYLFLILAHPAPSVDFSARGRTAPAKTPDGVCIGLSPFHKREHHTPPGKMFVPSSRHLNFRVIPAHSLTSSGPPTLLRLPTSPSRPRFQVPHKRSPPTPTPPRPARRLTSSLRKGRRRLRSSRGMRVWPSMRMPWISCACGRFLRALMREVVVLDQWVRWLRLRERVVR